MYLLAIYLNYGFWRWDMSGYDVFPWVNARICDDMKIISNEDKFILSLMINNKPICSKSIHVCDRNL